jgi:diguanylate cyclase (GGDEF)-like protein/PAS domain S-box-containing protein
LARAEVDDDCTYPADEIPDIVTIIGATGQLRYTNSAGRRLLGYDLAELGEAAFDLIHPDDLGHVRAAIESLVGQPGTRSTFEFRIAHADGSWRHLQTFGTNLLDDPRMRGVVLHSQDITERREAEDRIEHERLHDRLTGFPTRRLFIEHLQTALRRATRLGSTLAVFGVDLDGLSLVNERWGYDRGDELLIRVGRDLDTVLRADDAVARSDAVIARFEDSFFILYEDIPDPTGAAAAAIAARLAEAVRERTVPVKRNAVVATATVGVVLSSDGSSDAESLLVDATSAMHVGKQRGRDRVEFFDKGVRQEAERRVKEIDDLRVGISENQLRLRYQPQVHIGSGRLRGVEALVRWKHPERGLVSPAEFIPLAEATGLIQPLGEWVLREACRQRALWEPLVETTSPFLMCVNVSSQQFNASFPELVARVLQETSAPPGSLCIEVTETALMTDVAAAIDTMRLVKSLGVHISIDDFGTGYSSLAQLKLLPVDEIKIDRSFVERLGQDREDTAIVAAIVAMAHALDLSVVAEGVETLEQLAQLRALDCELAQGFLFSRPLSVSSIRLLLEGRMRIEPSYGL